MRSNARALGVEARGEKLAGQQKKKHKYFRLTSSWFSPTYAACWRSDAAVVCEVRIKGYNMPGKGFEQAHSCKEHFQHSLIEQGRVTVS